MTSPMGWALGDARIPEDYYQPRHAEEILAMRHLKLCPWCQGRHFRAYPESPGSSCNQVKCECWCTEGTGQ